MVKLKKAQASDLNESLSCNQGGRLFGWDQPIEAPIPKPVMGLVMKCTSGKEKGNLLSIIREEKSFER